jgi:Ca2+-transporting ATPase
MFRKPRPRDESIMTPGLLTTAGLVGLFMAVCTLALISYGTNHYGHLVIGTSMGVTAFSLLLIAGAFEARSVTGTAITQESFDNRQLNWTALAEFVLAVLITQMEVLRRLFGTTQLSLTQWSLALAPAVALLVLWELGKLIARRGTGDAADAAPAARASTLPSG